ALRTHHREPVPTGSRNRYTRPVPRFPSPKGEPEPVRRSPEPLNHPDQFPPKSGPAEPAEPSSTTTTSSSAGGAPTASAPSGRRNDPRLAPTPPRSARPLGHRRRPPRHL